MLIGCVTGPDFSSALVQVKKANALKIGVELRLDFLNFDSLSLLSTLISTATGLVLLKHPHPTKSDIAKWSQLNADYLDLPWDFLEDVPSFPLKILRSYHNSEETPEDLEAILQSMPRADGYKIVTTAQSTLDALRMLRFVKKNKKLTGICMGPLGSITRILGPVVANMFDFCALEEKTASGQLYAEEMLEIYHYHRINSSTKIYGLIGNPVEQSPSFRTHNAFFRKYNINAVYVKMLLEETELSSFFALAQELEFGGLSVTIPFKEKIFPFLHECDPQAREIGAINTIKFSDKKLFGWNTDAPAALDVLEKKIGLSKSRIAILGAGGSARAIAYEAKKRGCEVKIYNRTLSRAQILAREFNCSSATLEKLTKYDILINTTPDVMPIKETQILPKTVIMDINLGESKKELLEQAALRECTCIRGEEMFEKQALKQFALWFSDLNIKFPQTLSV